MCASDSKTLDFLYSTMNTEDDRDAGHISGWDKWIRNEPAISRSKGQEESISRKPTKANTVGEDKVWPNLYETRLGVPRTVSSTRTRHKKPVVRQGSLDSCM